MDPAYTARSEFDSEHGKKVCDSVSALDRCDNKELICLPNVITSKILTVLSAPVVAKLLPSALTLTLLISEVWARNSFTNSTPTAIFFQNLTKPSIDEVIRKSVCGVTVTKDNWSLCMRDLEYRGDAGSAFT